MEVLLLTRSSNGEQNCNYLGFFQSNDRFRISRLQIASFPIRKTHAYFRQILPAWVLVVVTYRWKDNFRSKQNGHTSYIIALAPTKRTAWCQFRIWVASNSKNPSESYKSHYTRLRWTKINIQMFYYIMHLLSLKLLIGGSQLKRIRKAWQFNVPQNGMLSRKNTENDPESKETIGASRKWKKVEAWWQWRL